MTIGKKAIRTAIMTLGMRPYPNHMRNRGAKAILGSELKMVSTGVMIFFKIFDQLMSMATRIPKITVTANPMIISRSVVVMCVTQLYFDAISGKKRWAKVVIGDGIIYGFMLNTITNSCQKTRKIKSEMNFE